MVYSKTCPSAHPYAEGDVIDRFSTASGGIPKSLPPSPSRGASPSFQWGLGSGHGRMAMRPHEMGRRTAELPSGRESPERAQLSLAGAWGYPPPPPPVPLPVRGVGGRRKRTRARGHAPHEMGRRTAELPSGAGESREGAALFGGGLGIPPNPTGPLPVRGVSGRREGARAQAIRPHEMGRRTVEHPSGRESPERAQPSLAGAWGYPPNPNILGWAGENMNSCFYKQALV